ncbi:DUF4158 domain-containing protein [Streptosporangium sp. H16]|uniref:DUF4158 domain-containing protein n=1 Tax=Streptosporangium sp. H16 TaxID=3444184 RepID=UPI003F7B0182
MAVARLAEQFGVDPAGLRSYGRRAKTRTEHLRLVAKYLGWRLPTTLELKELDEFLLARAMEHDSPTLLFRLGCEYLISARVIRPGLGTVVERVAHARAEAQRETFDRLAHEFTEARCAALDGLLITDPEIRMTRLRWLATGPVEASPAAVKARGRIDPLAAADERAALAAQVLADVAQMRERGELADTVDALLTHAVRVEMTFRSWDVDWPSPPLGAPRAGRWPGSRDGGWPEKIVARLPVDLVAQVHAACWNTSKDAIEVLRRWRDAHPAVVLSREDLTGYEELAAQVSTPGQVWRAAIARALPVADHPA